MKLEFGKNYSGFSLNEIIPVSEINGTIYDLCHRKSGARLIYLDRDDDNKVFYAAFKTLPENSTGVFHIIEHSVLCGSKKYPVKEPFVDLLKGSMNTFLNAMTYPDKTVYPCASCNDKDFANLMSVYMDAVFSPAIYTCENIFRQEGHHVELFEKDAEPLFKGVVFNEMKGAYSNVDSMIYKKVAEKLFPDTPYRYSSGGDPSCIPDLTYEEFLNSHRKYYHPENCILYLYGNMDVEERMEFLDKEYLSKYERLYNDITINEQTPVEDLNVTGEYQISDGESLENNSYITYATVTGKYSDRERNMAYDVLFDALASNNDSPLKKLFIENEMGEDFSAYLSEGILHPYIVFKLRKTDAGKKDEFMKVLTEALEKYSREGIDKELLTASFNQMEFSLREGDTGSGPVGLNFGLTMLSSLLYGGRPETFLTYEDVLDKVRKGIETPGYFEGLIKDILKSNHRVLSVINPSRTFTENLDKKEKERLNEYKKSLSEKEIETLIKMNNDLVEFQSREDSPEASATIPTLEISDIDTKAPLLETAEKEKDGIKILHHDFKTNKISYIRMYFDMSGVNEEDIAMVSFLSELYCNIPTKDHSVSDLNTVIKKDLGEMSAYTSNYHDITDVEKCHPFFVFGISVLDSKVERAFEIASEVINGTVFDKKEVEAILKQRKERLKMAYIRSGTSAARRRLSSYNTGVGKYDEYLDGYDYYSYLKNFAENFDSEFENFKNKAEKVVSSLFAKNLLTVSLTGSKEALATLENSLSKLGLSDKPKAEAKMPDADYSGNEGFNIPSQVNYVAYGCNIFKNGIRFTGKMDVLCQILRLDYMWNAVRVKGGAYGSGFTISRASGELYASSYRDPGVAPTMENIRMIEDYLKDFAKNHDDITKYIISSASDLTSPLSEKDRGYASDSAYFSGVTNEMRKARLEEALSTTPEDIENFAYLASLLKEKGKACVIGAKDKIDLSSDFTIRKEL